MNTEISKIMHHDYLEVCKMRSSTATKVWLLTVIFGQNPDTWRVTGVTEAALKVFAKHDFKRVSRMGVHRSHLVSRDETYRKMLEKPIEDFDEWWQLYHENDKCVLATSGENNSGRLGKIIPIDVDAGMFRSKGYSWQHRLKMESKFLRKLHRGNLPSQSSIGEEI